MHFNQNKAINTLIVSTLRSQQVHVELLKDSINITYGILNYIFQILDSENVLVMQIIPCLAILSKKTESDIAIIVKNFMKKMIC